MLRLLLSLVLALGGISMSDDLLARLERLEADNASLRGQVGALSLEAVRGSRSRRDAMSAADMNALLAPRSVGNPLTPRVGRDTVPDLGSPLMARLRDDAGLQGVTTGRPDPFAGYANLLDDPTFDTLGASPLGAFTTIGTAYTAISPEWEAKYVLNSGTVATTRSAGQYATRYQSGFTYGSSGVMSMTFVFGVNASDMTIYLRPSTAYSADGSTITSWLTAAVRLALESASNVTATAYLEIVDSADTVLASGDAEDLINLLDLAEQSRLEVGYETPVLATDYRFRLRIDITKTAGSAGSVYVLVTEPLLAFSDDGSAPAFTPAVGTWLPGLPGYQLVALPFIYVNIPASATTELLPGSTSMTLGGVPRLYIPWKSSIVGMAYRMSAAPTAGTINIQATAGGSNVWAPFGALGSGMNLADSFTQPAFIDTVDTLQGVGVQVVTNGAYTPATRDIHVTLWLLVSYLGT